MALIDDIEFYGRAVAAGELDRARAAELLARLDRLHLHVTDAIRALDNGRPIPEHVDARWREDMRRRARETALRMIRRTGWDETPDEADRYHFDRDEESR